MNTLTQLNEELKETNEFVSHYMSTFSTCIASNKISTRKEENQTQKFKIININLQDTNTQLNDNNVLIIII